MHMRAYDWLFNEHLLYLRMYFLRCLQEDTSLLRLFEVAIICSSYVIRK